MAFIEIVRADKAGLRRGPEAPTSSPSDAGVAIAFVRPSAADKLMPDWRGLADSALEPNVFMAPEFVLPAAAHLARNDDFTLAAAWRTHARSRELIGLFAVAADKRARFGWLQPRRAALWTHPLMPRGAPLLSRDPEQAGAALAALAGALAGGRHTQVRFPALETDRPVARLIAGAAEAAGGGLFAEPDEAHSRGLDVMLSRAPDAGPVTVAATPSALRAMLEQALAMDAAVIRQPGEDGPALFAADELAFLRAVVRGLAQTGQIVMARLSDGPRKAAAVALLEPDRAFLWRLFGPAAHDPTAEAALACAIRDATGRPVTAAAPHPTAGFCTTALATQTLLWER